MSELREFYTKKVGHDPKTLEVSPWYLGELALRAAGEVSNPREPKERKFDHCLELAEILKKYQPTDQNSTYPSSRFPSMPLWRTMMSNGKKEVRTIDDLGLEMSLLRAELETTAEKSSDQAEELTSFLLLLSKQYTAEADRSSRHQLTTT